MNNLDDSENNAKISDSAYSNSCSNSQSRRSHSSKSTHSGSHSSGSSGYGGKPSTSGSSNQLPEKRIKEKEPKKKKQVKTEATVTEVQAVCRDPDPAPILEVRLEEQNNVDRSTPPVFSPMDKGPESMDISTPDTPCAKEEVLSCNGTRSNSCINIVTSLSSTSYSPDGFTCVISMQDGVVMYTTATLTTTLGFPKDMWNGRSFIDFVHPKDRSTFASQITSGLAIPKVEHGTQEKVQAPGNSGSTMACRIRRYKGLASGFCIKERISTFTPFLLKLSFKNINGEKGDVTYLVIQATPLLSAFKVPYELVTNPIPFIIRHSADGNLEYIDPDSVTYLGYLPQDVTGKDALQLYHPDDLSYLKQVYETIVKEGGLPRCTPYRMMTQNGNYVKLETEWSSFINPWSRKLEFVTGKHFIIQGPCNPDVFETPEEKSAQMLDEKRSRQNDVKENIVRIMNEVMTKPAEVAKQQMSKRCQDLAFFMESLMEEQPKNDEELRLEIQDADHSYYERDSMLGGISPHHDYSDRKSSTGTPLSYTQINYNETLQRYFDSHQPFTYDEYTVPGENILVKDAKVNCLLSPMAQHSDDYAMRVASPIVTQAEYQPTRLTEPLLSKHNTEMEKELLRRHREIRPSNKGEREKSSNETRQKKKEHLARCNASFQPTAAGAPISPDINDRKINGLKRASKQTDNVAHKHHCTSLRQTRRRHIPNTTAAQTSTTTVGATISAVGAATHWHPNAMNNMNTFIVGVGIPPPMSIISPMIPQQMAMQGVPGMYPMYYATAPTAPVPSTSEMNASSDLTNAQFSTSAMQGMMYGQPVYGSPFMYSAIGPQVQYPVQQTMIQCTNSLNPLGLINNSYKEASQLSAQPRRSKLGGWWRDTRQDVSNFSRNQRSIGLSNTATSALNRSTEAVPTGSKGTNFKDVGMRNSEKNNDKTDGESSYSSFYSSFFKTESESAEESTDPMKGVINKNGISSGNFWSNKARDDPSMEIDAKQSPKNVNRRKMEPPWTEQVCVTSELIYKYQILTKNMDEVLLADKKRMRTFSQPKLVNEQLGQLYLDLQLEGVAARLTLDEGITSSSSSGEETATNQKSNRKKREYSKLVMIYEEDAPLPPPSTDDNQQSSYSAT